jgi:hypothetical protein
VRLIIATLHFQEWNIPSSTHLLSKQTESAENQVGQSIQHRANSMGKGKYKTGRLEIVSDLILPARRMSEND